MYTKSDANCFNSHIYCLNMKAQIWNIFAKSVKSNLRCRITGLFREVHSKFSVMLDSFYAQTFFMIMIINFILPKVNTFQYIKLITIKNYGCSDELRDWLLYGSLQA